MMGELERRVKGALREVKHNSGKYILALIRNAFSNKAGS
jgi:hypothetical protein